MTDIVLKDADPILFDRIRRVADARGWELPHALQYLLEQGLHVYEGDGSVRFDNDEADALQAMIRALEQVPDDPGYAAIGRVRQQGERGARLSWGEAAQGEDAWQRAGVTLARRHSVRHSPSHSASAFRPIVISTRERR